MEMLLLDVKMGQFRFLKTLNVKLEEIYTQNVAKQFRYMIKCKKYQNLYISN